MRRLLIKELRSAWWVIALAYAITLVLILIGDPLAFRGDSGAFGWLVVPFLILGLRAYSGELGANTVEFLYSRPIKWWQILLAKLIVGIIAIVSTVLLGLLLYVLTAPRYYMPFLHETVLSGLGEMMGLLGVAFILGFGASALMPGIALSFIALLGIGVALGVVASFLDWIGRTFLISWLQGPVNAVFYSVGTGLIASILIIRKLPKLGVRQRWTVVGRFLVVGLAIGLILAAFGIPGEQTSKPSPMSLSRDGRLALYGKDTYYPQGKLGLVDTRSGEVQLVIPSQEPRSFAWSPDSRKVAFTENNHNILVVTASPKPEGWKAKSFESNGLIFTTMTWSPDSRFVAVRHEHGGEFVPTKTESVLLDTARKSVRPIKTKQFDRLEDVVPGNTPVYVKGHGLFWPPVVE